MELIGYAELVYFHFYRKVDEVNYFIQEAVSIAENYKTVSPEERNFMFDKMQFTFSAYINALISCWEISKVSIELSNDLNDLHYKNGIPSENDLENDLGKFIEYFSCDETSHRWFKFMKDVRNANAHDGTATVNGGDDHNFLIQTALDRFTRDRKTKKLTRQTSVSPKKNAIAVILDTAIALIPLFEAKLNRPTLSMEDHRSFAKFKLSAIPGFMDDFLNQEEELIAAMVGAQLQIQNGRNCSEYLTKWRQQREST